MQCCECNMPIHNVAFTTLSQPKHNVVTTLLQRDFVCWDHTSLTAVTSPENVKAVLPAFVSLWTA